MRGSFRWTPSRRLEKGVDLIRNCVVQDIDVIDLVIARNERLHLSLQFLALRLDDHL